MNSGTATSINNSLNTGFGQAVLGSLDITGAGGNFNCAFGFGSLFTNSTGNNNASFGNSSCANYVGSDMAAFGSSSFTNLTSGDDNCGFGSGAFAGLLTGNFNCGFGSFVGSSYTGAESSNILIQNSGVVGESHTMRLGTDGMGDGTVSSTYIAGVVGVTVPNQQRVVIDSSTGQLGVQSGSIVSNYTNVTFGMSPYTVLATDYYISCDTSGGAITLNFPNAPTAFQEWIVKDRTGNSAANNVTITTPGGVVTFDGSTTLLLNTAYAAFNLLANATPTYEVF
jgi:hypothetical protein